MYTKPLSKLIQRGISLIELIMFIVIISIAVASILLVMNTVNAHSADTLVRKQALAVAESLLEEVELQDFIAQTGVATCVAPNPVTLANRASSYHIVCDYNGFNMPAPPGIYSMNNLAVTGLSNYSANVKVAGTTLGGIAAASSVLITVTVTDPQGGQVALSGYRTAY